MMALSVLHIRPEDLKNLTIRKFSEAEIMRVYLVHQSQVQILPHPYKIEEVGK